MINKVLNHREQFNLDTEQIYASNFYPITHSIAGRDMKSAKQITIINDRS